LSSENSSKLHEDFFLWDFSLIRLNTEYLTSQETYWEHNEDYYLGTGDNEKYCSGSTNRVNKLDFQYYHIMVHILQCS